MLYLSFFYSYLQPSFDPHKRYGMHTGYDPRGIWVRCACHWHNTNPITSVSKIQADVTERQQARVGRVFEPYALFVFDFN